MNLDGAFESRHVKRVLATVEHGNEQGGSPVDRQTLLPRSIEASWRRCVTAHGIEPHKVRRPVILSKQEVAPLREEFDVLASVYTPELDRLHARLAKLDYVVLLANAEGITLDVRCAREIDKEARDNGLHLGAMWSENLQGTNGVGTCLATGQPISVVMDDHFALHNTPLTCTVAPIYTADRRLLAALDVSTPRPTDHQAQQLIMQIVANAARRIENQLFLATYGNEHTVLEVSQDARFSDLASAALVAFSANGRIAAWSPTTAAILDPVVARPVIEQQMKDRLEKIIAQDESGGSLVAPGGSAAVRFHIRPLSRGEPLRGPGGPAARAQARHSAHRDADLRTSLSSEMIVGNDPAMLRNLALAERIVDSDLPILLQGETGTGKELFAKHLHRLSQKSKGPFVAVNCAAIPENLIEGELFGYRPGAFTGAAKTGYQGRIAEANHGVLFLDEIGDMPLALQSRLLRVLSELEVTPLAGRPVKLDLLVISSTHQDLETLVAEKRFREDLYYRIAGANIVLPPLRKRRDRKSFISEVFAAECRQAQRHLTLSRGVTEFFESYPWPGNIREIKQALRYAIAISEGDTVDLDALPPRLVSAFGVGASAEQRLSADRQVIAKTLERCGWKVSAAAELLGISRSTLHRKMKQLQIRR